MCVLRIPAILTLVALVGPEGVAQDAPPQNLQILSPSLSRDSIIAIMGGFTRALGVRCTHCHVAVNGVRPTDAEFALDSLEPKRVARAMLRMVAEINTRHLPSTGRRADALLQVGCATCHRGLTRPRPLEDELLQTYDRAGIDSTMALYRALRTRYFGTGAYDFSDVALPTLADRIAVRGDRMGDAVALMQLNLEHHPRSWFTYQQLGQLQLSAGDTTAAIRSFRAGLAINPQRPFLQELLRRAEQRPLVVRGLRLTAGTSS